MPSSCNIVACCISRRQCGCKVDDDGDFVGQSSARWWYHEPNSKAEIVWKWQVRSHCVFERNKQSHNSEMSPSFWVQGLHELSAPWFFFMIYFCAFLVPFCFGWVPFIYTSLTCGRSRLLKKWRLLVSPGTSCCVESCQGDKPVERSHCEVMSLSPTEKKEQRRNMWCMDCSGEHENLRVCQMLFSLHTYSLFSAFFLEIVFNHCCSVALLWPSSTKQVGTSGVLLQPICPKHHSLKKNGTVYLNVGKNIVSSTTETLDPPLSFGLHLFCTGFGSCLAPRNLVRSGTWRAVNHMNFDLVLIFIYVLFLSSTFSVNKK